MKRTNAVAIVLVLSVLGFLVAAYSLYYHYGTGQGWCDISATFSCDVVNRGEYAEIYGIPVALVGMIGYVVMFGLVWVLRKEDTPEWRRLLFFASLLGTVFTLYLLYIEAFVLYTFCIVCLASALVMFVIFLCSLGLLKKTFK